MAISPFFKNCSIKGIAVGGAYETYRRWGVLHWNDTLMNAARLVQRFHGSNHIEINHHRPRPEERALARVSKDGHKRDRARGHPSRRPREERGLLRMRSEGGVCDVRYDWLPPPYPPPRGWVGRGLTGRDWGGTVVLRPAAQRSDRRAPARRLLCGRDRRD